MVSHGSGIDQRRPSVAVPAPPGATLASFVLFAALAALLAMMYAASEWWNLAGSFGFPTDAAWARAVFSRNLASGEGLCFNRGIPVAGAAGSSWIALLAITGFFAGKFLLTAKVLGTLCVILAAYLVWHISLRLLGDWRFAFLAALLVAANPRMTAWGLSGTEATWAALAVMAVIHWQAVGREGGRYQRTLGAIAIGLAALSRPELILLLPLALADRWLMMAAHEEPGHRLGSALRSIPEFFGALAVVTPFVVYNLRSGGPLWQQPEMALRSPATWAWAGVALNGLWLDNPLLYCAALIGVPVVLVSVLRSRSQHPSLLLVLLPLTVVIFPGFIWPQASAENGLFAAPYLTPIAAILGVSGLFLLYKGARQFLFSEQPPIRRFAFSGAIGVTVAALLGFLVAAHPPTWREYGFQVKKVSDLQGFIGRWAADHLAADASIASREVGAIGFFSGRRMVDLGGTISREGLAALSQSGSPDSNLLAYLQKTRPSHLAIRPSDFPDLSQRPDLLTPAVTCVVTDPFTGGVTTMALYETPWPPLSVMEVRAQAGGR